MNTKPGYLYLCIVPENSEHEPTLFFTLTHSFHRQEQIPPVGAALCMELICTKFVLYKTKYKG